MLEHSDHAHTMRDPALAQQVIANVKQFAQQYPTIQSAQQAGMYIANGADPAWPNVHLGIKDGMSNGAGAKVPGIDALIYDRGKLVGAQVTFLPNQGKELGAGEYHLRL